MFWHTAGVQAWRYPWNRKCIMLSRRDRGGLSHGQGYSAQKFGVGWIVVPKTCSRIDRQSDTQIDTQTHTHTLITKPRWPYTERKVGLKTLFCFAGRFISVHKVAIFHWWKYKPNFMLSEPRLPVSRNSKVHCWKWLFWILQDSEVTF